MAAILLIVGALLIVAGCAAIFWPAGVIALGAVCVSAGVDLTRQPAKGEG